MEVVFEYTLCVQPRIKDTCIPMAKTKKVDQGLLNSLITVSHVKLAYANIPVIQMENCSFIKFGNKIFAIPHWLLMAIMRSMTESNRCALDLICLAFHRWECI